MKRSRRSEEEDSGFRSLDSGADFPTPIDPRRHKTSINHQPSTLRMNCQHHLHRGIPARQLARRWFLQECGIGLGAISLSQLAGARSASAATAGGRPQGPHHAPKAKNVIYLFMAGAPSHLELFDYKP